VKKILLAAFLVAAYSLKVHATATVYAQLGPLSMPVPWEAANAVYLYNETDKVSEVGGEVVLMQLKAGSFQGNPVDLDFTAGGVLDPTNNNVGTAFVGTNIWLPNPLPNFVLLNTIQPGLFGGYAIADHKWVFGLKAAIPIFK